MPHPSGLTRQQIAEIQDKWHRRTTMESLATEYGISQEMVRKILFLPDKEGGD